MNTDVIFHKKCECGVQKVINERLYIQKKWCTGCCFKERLYIEESIIGVRYQNELHEFIDQRDFEELQICSRITNYKMVFLTSRSNRLYATNDVKFLKEIL